MMLSRARVCSSVQHTSGSKFFKALMIDIGLVSVQLGLFAHPKIAMEKLVLSNKGSIAEQFIGQQFRVLQSLTQEPQLFYWQRTGGRLGEIDYIIQHGEKIVPVEVKSGSAGSMKSLHQFMHDKKLDFAVRCDTNQASIQDINVKTTCGQPVSYRLLSIPVYLAERLSEIISLETGVVI